jgi:hypothetical protein
MLTPAAAQWLKVANKVAKKLGAMIHRKIAGCTVKIAIHTSIIELIYESLTGRSSCLCKEYHSDHLLIIMALTYLLATANILYINTAIEA